jgi:hypothetical protein
MALSGAAEHPLRPFVRPGRRLAEAQHCSLCGTDHRARGLSCPNLTDDIGSSSAPPACYVSGQYWAEARLTMPGLLSNPPNCEQ